jgi:RNA polymerase sigma-70 factor (ECF subfamily)
VQFKIEGMEKTETPIRELLELCLSSEDERYWHEFVARTQPLIANVIINTLRRWRDPQPSLVDDLIQDTYMRLFAKDRKALRGLRNEYENTIFAYLKKVAFNATCDHGRQGKNVEEVPLDDVTPLPSPDGFKRIEFERRKDQIQNCLERLPEESRRRDQSIFWLYFEQGFTAKEISLLPGMGLTVKGVESVILRLTRFLNESGIGSSNGNDG